MKRSFLLCLIIGVLAFVPRIAPAQQSGFRVLAFYSENVEHDHVDFTHQAIRFYADLAQRNHFEFASTTSWDDLNATTLAKYQLILWLNDVPHTLPQRIVFEQ